MTSATLPKNPVSDYDQFLAGQRTDFGRKKKVVSIFTETLASLSVLAGARTQREGEEPQVHQCLRPFSLAVELAWTLY